jgi:hypothetical protein
LSGNPAAEDDWTTQFCTGEYRGHRVQEGLKYTPSHLNPGYRILYTREGIGSVYKRNS